MKKLILWMVALVALAGGVLHAQDVTGTWQGTLKVDKDQRVIVVVTKDNVKQTVIKDGFQNLETIQKSLPKEKWPN